MPKGIPTSSFLKISPKQFVRQWQGATHKMELNLWNFEVKAGKAAQETFRESFVKKGFNDSKGIAWAPRSPKSRAKHPLMNETGTLKKSIKWKHLGPKDASQGVEIYTDQREFVHAARHKGFCYAAVHNDPTSAGTRTGRVAHMPRRQFMGHSDILNNKLKELTIEIFKGLPK